MCRSLQFRVIGPNLGTSMGPNCIEKWKIKSEEAISYRQSPCTAPTLSLSRIFLLQTTATKWGGNGHGRITPTLAVNKQWTRDQITFTRKQRYRDISGEPISSLTKYVPNLRCKGEKQELSIASRINPRPQWSESAIFVPKFDNRTGNGGRFHRMESGSM